jgi:hypothetical protein
MWFSRIFKRPNKFSKKRYLKRLRYALNKLEHPVYNDFAELDNRFRRAAINWLIAYYSEDRPAVDVGTPEVLFKKLISKPVSCIEVQDYVFIKVLHDWIEHKRVEGF